MADAIVDRPQRKGPQAGREVILRRPRLFAELIRELRETPDEAIYRVVREVRDGNW